MAGDNTYQILTVAGDYGIVQCVHRALPPARFSVENAFNHRDAAYMLEQGQYDAFIVDAAMVDRFSGKSTLAMLAEAQPGLPLIVYTSDQSLLETTQYQADAVVSTLDQKEMYQAVYQAMRIAPNVTAQIPPKPSFEDALERRADEMGTLFALSKSLTEVLDLSEVLNRVVNAARDLTNADEGMILLPEGDALYLRAKVGMDVETARNFRIKITDNLAGNVFKSGKPTLLGASGPQKVKTQYFVNSLLYVPILLQGQAIGVLGVNNREKEDPFDITHQQLLMTLASFAAIAINNARVHQDSLTRSRELETLVAASQVVNSSLSLAETLPNICLQLASVLQVGYAEIYNWNQDEQHLRTISRFYQASWRFGQGPGLDVEQSPALKMALESNRQLWLKNSLKEYANEASYLRQVGADAMMIIPLCTDNRVLGALRIFFIDPREELPRSEDIDPIHDLALESLDDLFAQGRDQISSSALHHLALQVNQNLGADWFELSIKVKGSASLNILALMGQGVWLSSTTSTIDLKKYPDLVDTLKNRSVITIANLDATITPSGVELLRRTLGRSLLAVPLVQRGQTKGLVVFAETKREREFTNREIDMARAIVGQAATALENANLVHDLELSLQKLKDAQDLLVQTARLSAMGELAAVVAHQINNPLTTIIVDTELMLMDEEEGSLNHRSLEAINRAGKRAANVARRLLAIARPTDPDTPADPIDVVDTVRGVLSLVQTHVERSSIRVNAELPKSEVPPVMAVKGRLDDVWLNLIMNAHDALIGDQYKDKEIQVDVRYVPEDREVEVIVADNGEGIPDDIKRQIFSPFFTTKPVGEGTGLGLHVCREVVENTGGSIAVESEPGKFTKFVVRLPAVKS